MVYSSNCKSNTGQDLDTYKALLCLHNWVSWKASLWLNQIPLSRAVKQRVPLPRAYCVFSFDVSPCCAYSKNTSRKSRLQENVNVQSDSDLFQITMRISSMKDGKKECASCQHLLVVFIKLDASQGIEKL